MKGDWPRSALVLSWLMMASGFGAMSTASAAGDEGRDSGGSWLVAQATEFSESELETFVNAREKVVDISSDWEDRLNNAESQDELNDMQQAMQEEMVQAVQDEGLSVNEYNTIVSEAQSDEDLQRRIDELMASQ